MDLFSIKEEGGKFLIIRSEDGKTVGTSDTREKAERSIQHRVDAIKGKGKELSASAYPQVYEDLALDLNKLGCVMLDIDHEFPSLPANIEKLLYFAKNKDHFWIDGYVAGKNPHITLLYGLLHEAESYKKHIISVMSGWEIEDVTIKEIGVFPSHYKDDRYHCIVAHIEVTPKLQEGNNRLRLLPHVDTFPEYKPHLTLAYIEENDKAKEKAVAFFQSFVGVKLKVEPELNLGGNK